MEVSDQLANLGVMISGQIEKSVLQNQYQTALPVMQEIFKDSMSDFDKGNSGAGFSRIMGVAMQYPNNPYIQNLSQMAFTAGKLSADDFLRKQQIEISRAKSIGTQITPEEEAEFNAFGGIGGGGGVIGGEDVLPEASSEPDQQALTDEPDLQQQLEEVPDSYQLQPGEQIIDASFLQDYGIPVKSVIGPKRFATSESQVSESVTLGGKQSKTKTTKPTEKNVEEETKFQEFANRIIKADKQIKANKQLRNIVALSGNDLLNNVDLEEEGDKQFGITYSAIVRSKDGTETKEDLTLDEYNVLKTIKEDATDAPGIKFIRTKPTAEAPVEPQKKTERFPVKAESATQQPTSGLPAAQLPSAPDNPFTKLVEESSVRQSKSQKTSNEKSLRTRISDYDKKIASLSGGSTRKDLMRPEFLQKQKDEYDRLWREREVLKSELEKLTSSK